MARLQSSMFARRSFSVVNITKSNPRNSLGLVVTTGFCDSIEFTSQLILDLKNQNYKMEFSQKLALFISLFSELTAVKNKLLEMLSKCPRYLSQGPARNRVIKYKHSKNWLTSRNVISRALSFHLDQDREVDEVLSVPLLERFQQLQTLALRVDFDVTGFVWSLIGIDTRIVTLGWQAFTARRLKFEFASISSSQLVLARIEVQSAGQRQSGNQFGRGDKSMSCRICVVASSEIL